MRQCPLGVSVTSKHNCICSFTFRSLLRLQDLLATDDLCVGSILGLFVAGDGLLGEVCE